MNFKGILGKRERELIERDTYNQNEFNKEYRDEWEYGNDLIDELISEYETFENEYYIEEYIED